MHQHLAICTLWQLTLMAVLTPWTSSTSALHLPPSIFPTEDQASDFRDDYAKRIFPVEDQGHGYRDFRTKRIFPTEDQGYGYRNYHAKRIFPTQDQGYGYRNNYAKRIFPTQDQGYGYRNNYAKRVFPTEDQGHGYRNYFTKRIFPSDQGYGYRNYRAKRVYLDTRSLCNLCILTYHPDACVRCWRSRSPVVPIFAKRSEVATQDQQQEAEVDDYPENLEAQASETGVLPFTQELQPDERGNHSAILEAEKGYYDDFSTLIRQERSGACSCCYLSRLSDQRCCHLCQLSAKPSENLLTSEMDTGESDLPSKRAYLANPDCFCCWRHGSLACCSRCFEK